MRLARIAPPLTLLVLVGPLAFGLAGTLLPAFGYLPSLGGTRFSLDAFHLLAGTPGIVRSAATSILAGLVTTLLALLCVVAFAAGHLDSPLFLRMRRLISPLLAVPHAAAAFGFAFLVAPSGLMMRLVSPWLTGLDRPPDVLIVHDPMAITMVAGLVIKEIPFLFLVMMAALPQLRHKETLQLGRCLGYGRVASFIFLLWPQIYAQMRLAVFAVLAYATSVVDVAVILGPQLPPTLPVRLIEWMNDPELQTRYLASAGALLQLVATFAALLGWLGIERIGGLLVSLPSGRGLRFRHDRPARHAALAAMALSALMVFGGIAMLGLWSLAGLWQFPKALPSAFTLDRWSAALPRILDPLVTTLWVAGISTAIAVVLTILCLERELETGRGQGGRSLMLIYLPLIVPQISFMFGLQVLAIAAGVEGTAASLVLAHLVFVLPYVFLSLSDPWRAHDRRYDAIAAGLGMSRTRALMRVRLPMLARAILTAAAVGFAVSVGQYLPTVLIGAGRLTTVTSEAVALAAGGNGRVIGVYGFLQTVLPFLAFAIATAVPNLLFRHRRGLRL
ncbi:putative thiamine transport system permease protein [Hoeflea marina]|uniref:Putative thiamine transport system permease protein n=2 Tax=Hoeflea marina TaxID=274592 RepID=A0A317PJK7_9HYPH|nr:ABC transporter permease subunit [Hoeflea marina]PWW00484.1 putative thiamine transport system permease protein [Hoeflea marina]